MTQRSLQEAEPGANLVAGTGPCLAPSGPFPWVLAETEAHSYLLGSGFAYLLMYLFIKKVEEREKEKYRLVASHVPPTGDLVRSPGMCPDGESNL